ncbi:YhcG family protein [Paraburkholderia sp. DGU8]|uniref:PDDEXK nuclease domain-containing protein n=1 Tax=Paraburkholderia sp. DGU8 TaxID=3161997 RepID=UPI003466A35B
MTKVAIAPGDYAGLHKEVVSVVESARRTAARNVNAVMTAAYWEIGRRIVASEQGGQARAGYGQALIARLAEDLTRRFGRGFGKANLASMRAFYVAWPAAEIFQTVSGKSAAPGNVQTPSGKSLPAKDVVDATATAPDYMALATRFTLPWSAYVRLLSVKTAAARAFYETEALREGWSVRQLDRQIGSQLYERLALSRNKAALLRKAADVQPGDLLTPEEAIRDPFVLEFLDIKDEYSESDLEEALIQHLADFLLELGDDFAFVGRQRRLRIDDTWFRVDLVFFHRRLKCLVIIDLKVGRFSYADAGQMHLYLNYAREHWMKSGENPPVGLILCAEKGAAEAHYALDNLSNKILAAEYQTVLPDEAMIVQELERTAAELERRTAAS